MSHRLERIAEQIQQELAALFLREVKDDRLAAVSVTGVRVSPDLALAHVHYVILAVEDEALRREVARSLERASGFLRTTLAQRLKLRHMPALQFHFDASLERGLRMETLLSDLRERGEMGEPAAPDDADSGEEVDEPEDDDADT